MTLQEQRQQLKATALNAIIKIYHPLNVGNKHFYSGCSWEEESWAEQRDRKVSDIMERLQKDLNKLKGYKSKE